MTDISLQEMTNGELKGALVPKPEDLLSEVTPVGCLWYSQEVVAYSLMAWTAEMTNAENLDDEAETLFSGVLSTLAETLGMIETACKAVGLISE